MSIYTYCTVKVSSMPCLETIRTKQAGSSQNPTASEEEDEEVIGEALREKQGYLPLPPTVKDTSETTFGDASASQSKMAYDDDRG